MHGLLFPPQALGRLRSYRYESAGTSLLDGLFFQTRLVEPLSRVLPRTLAPNTITLLGLLAVVVAFLVTLWPVAAAPTNRLLVGLLVYLYLVLDSLDGKQARNTGSASPLGEFLDHAVDALVVSLIALVICVQHGVGREAAFLGLTLANAVFLLPHVVHRCVHVLFFFSLLSPTELVHAFLAHQTLLFLFPSLSFPSSSPISLSALLNAALFLVLAVSAAQSLVAISSPHTLPSLFGLSQYARITRGAAAALLGGVLPFVLIAALFLPAVLVPLPPSLSMLVLLAASLCYAAFTQRTIVASLLGLESPSFLAFESLPAFLAPSVLLAHVSGCPFLCVLCCFGLFLASLVVEVALLVGVVRAFSRELHIKPFRLGV